MDDHTIIMELLDKIDTRLEEIGYYLYSLKRLVFCIMLLVVGILILLLSGCANYTYNGIRSEDLRHPTLEMAAGVGTAFVVHAAGHFVAMSAMGHELHFEGLSEVTDDELTDSEAAWFGRAGFLAADGVGWVAKALGANGDFWRGYNAGVAFETMTYPMWQPIRGEGDDLRLIDRDGDGSLEWGLWSAAALGLNFENTKGRSDKPWALKP